MLEAITGVPAANASVRIMPKLSPASDGAQSTSASCSERQSSIGGHATAGVDPGLDLWVGELRATSERSTPITVRRAGTCSTRALERGEQDRQALALLGAADEQQIELVGARAAGFGAVATAGAACVSTPFGITS